MSHEEQQQPQERIEAHGNQRFKMVGTRIVAVEQKCFHCQQTYWSPIVAFSPDAKQLNTAHQCPPDARAGASVINKFG
jgi:hypothetical protein